MIEPYVDVENCYYNSKSLKEENPESALTSFYSIVEKCEGEQNEWAFKALKQITKINFQLKKYDDMLQSYQRLLGYTNWLSITKNYSEKSIYNIVEYASSCENTEFLEKFYDVTTKALQNLNNERLMLKVLMHVARFLLTQKNYHKFKYLLRQMHELLSDENNSVADQNRGTHLLELYSLEIQMYSDIEDNKRLKELYQSSLRVKTAIPHPRIMGIIRECGGKMHMQENQWSEAQTNFFESFKSYDEAGSSDRIRVLKYLVLANMLSESEINPFDSPETQPYKDNPHIIAMTKLVEAYQIRDITAVERILQTYQHDILDDDFIRQYVDKILYSIRSQVLIELVKPYTSVKLSLLAKKLGVSISIIEQALVGLIIDERVNGKIDMVNEVFTISQPKNTIHNQLVEDVQKLWNTATK